MDRGAVVRDGFNNLKGFVVPHSVTVPNVIPGVATTVPMFAALISDAHLGVVVCAISGSLIFILWDSEMPLGRRLGYWLIGSILGIFLGPSLASWALLGGLPAALGALIVGAFSVTVINLALESTKKHDWAGVVARRYNRFRGREENE